MIGGNITYVHQRLWLALVRLANFFDKKTLAALRVEHTQSGAHRLRTIPFARWVPPDVRQVADNISEEKARRQLGDWVGAYLRRRHAKTS